MESIVKLGHVDPGDKLGCDLHNSARCGNRKHVKRILEKGIQVDYPNNLGQSPLFCACYCNEDAVARELLKYGGNPNERCNNGMTPVHMVAYNCNLKLLTELLAAGGDLRLHDITGRTSKEFALLQPDPKKRMKMLEFIEKTRIFALTKSGRDLRVNAHIPSSQRYFPPRTNSIMKMIRDKIRGDDSISLDHQMTSCHSMGYGKVYQDGDNFSGIICTLPLVSETLLKHDPKGLSFNNGAFMVMESMLWKNTNITVKRLHREAAPGGEVDLLITAAEYIGKLRHSNVLTLMGVCQTNNLESMVLLFERIEEGSLFEVLHQRLERLSTSRIESIIYQIADALVFLHERYIIHCFVTSHAIMLVNEHCAKLANFEYVVDSTKADNGKKSFVNQNMYQNVAYNWMAPEIMRNGSPSTASDVYSLTVIIWEMFHGEVPWAKYDSETVRYKLFKEKEQLEIELDRIPEVFQIILQHGLQLDPLHRKLQMYNVRNLIKIPKENVKPYMEKLLRLEDEINPSKPAKPERPPKTWKGDGETSNNRGSRSDRSSSKSPKGKGYEDNLDEDQPERRVIYRDNQNRSTSKSPRAESTPRKSLDHQDDQRYNHNQSSKSPTCPDYVHDNRYRFVDRMCFNHKDLDWELKEEQQGPEYFYTVNVAKDQGVKHAASEQSESEAASTISYQTSENGGNKSLLNKFSYLKVQEQSKSPPGKYIKPASHCTEGLIECPVEKKLSTAGSIYALYNMDYHTPQRVTTDARSQLYNTMPRKRKKMAGETPQTTEIGPSLKEWYGDQGSVKNLVEMYQKQQHEHNFQQDILKGKLLPSGKSDGQKKHAGIYPDIQNISPFKTPKDCNNQALVGEKDVCDVTHSSSLTTVSPEEVKGKQSSSSPDSDMIDNWVDSELFRIQSTLSQEVFDALDEKKTENTSPLLFEDKYCTPSTSKKKSKPKKKNKPKKQFDVEEFYIDDEIHPDTHKLSQRKYNKQPDYIKPLRELYQQPGHHKDQHYNSHKYSQGESKEHYNTYDYSSKQPKDHHHGDQNRRLNDSYGKQNVDKPRYKQHDSKREHCYNSIDSDSLIAEISRVEKNKQLKKLQTSFHSIPQYYDDKGTKHSYVQDVDNDVYPRVVDAVSETDQQKLKKRVEERAAFSSTVTVETNTLYPDQHRVTHTLTDLSDGTTSTLYGKNVKATKLMSALIAQ